MKKFLIYLTSFLFLFGVSVAFAGFYIEDFENGNIDPWETISAYEIEDGKFHMLTGTVEGGYVHGTVSAYYPNEFVYHFEGETKMVIDQFNLHPTIYYYESSGSSMHIELSFYGWPHGEELMEIKVHLYQNNVDIATEYLEELTSGMLYSWSITAHEGHVTIGINNNTYEVFQGVFEKPPSVLEARLRYTVLRMSSKKLI